MLSAISGLPIDQGIAVTGSVDQMGEVQAIGGATFKIEGFYDVCKDKGLTGSQGVMIPKDNVKNLVLRDEVVRMADCVIEEFQAWESGKPLRYRVTSEVLANMG